MREVKKPKSKPAKKISSVQGDEYDLTEILDGISKEKKVKNAAQEPDKNP